MKTSINVKIAIIGCGQIADAHIQEARKINGVKIVAVCDSNIHMAKQAGMRFGISGIYSNTNLMLNEVKPDVVHITTPPYSHLSIAKTAIEHGSHVYIEKPFTVNSAEAIELITYADQLGKLVCVGHNYKFDSAFLRMKDLYESGELGNVIHVDAVMNYNLSGPFGSVFMKDPNHWVHKLPGGVPQNNISHPLSLILDFVKDKNPNIYAKGFRWRKEKYGDIRDRFFDELRVVIIGKEATAFMLFSCHSRPVQLYTIIHGTKRQAIVNIDARTTKVIEGVSMPGPFARVQWAYRDAKEAKREYYKNLSKLVKAQLHFFEGMNELFRRFYLAVEGKGESPIPASEALRTTMIMDEIIKQCYENDPNVLEAKL
ncbi:MAG: Gfo/Idh/MocA family protein [bacterium]